MGHAFLNIAIPIAAEREDEVNRKLDELGNPASEPVRDALRGRGVHFLSITVVPNDAKHSPFLVFEASLDGDDAGAVDRLVDGLGKFLPDVLTSAGLGRSGQGVAALLHKYKCPVVQTLSGTPGVNFTGSPGMTVGRIRAEWELGRKVRTLLEAPCADVPALTRLNQVRAAVEDDKELAPLLVPEAAPILDGERELSLVSLVVGGVRTFVWPALLLILALMIAGGFVAAQSLGAIGTVITVFVIMLMGLLGLACVGLLLYARLRKYERADIPDEGRADPELLHEVLERENRSEQNHLAGVYEMKPGKLRDLLLRLVFWVVAQLASRKYRPGFLNDLGTIHFARWFRLPGTNKLLFFSNYGGSWESYLEDFITKAHAGLTGVWSNTEGFPRTTNLFQGGATDGDRFKRWARKRHFPSRFWYSAYPYLTMDRVRHNAAIRLGLAAAATEDEAVEWLSYFGSQPPRPDAIEASEVQVLAFGGLSPLLYGACLLGRMPDDVSASRAWLAEASGDVTFGGGPLTDSATQVALARSGLEHLGLDARTIAQFPVAFDQGMAAPARANILGDTGDDKPKTWWWGNETNRADVAVMLYHKAEDGLESLLEAHRKALGQHGGAVAHEVRMKPIEGKTTFEPFGFADGISQPIIRGTRLTSPAEDALHVVEPGEFLLGYHDNRGHFPPTPTVPATADPDKLLTSTAPITFEDPTARHAETHVDRPRDLGRNGTFLVIRQLEQDVRKFNQYLEDTAEKLATGGHPGVPAGMDVKQLGEWVAAKMVGRWRDGTSLVSSPNRPGTGWKGDRPSKPDNSFWLGADDPLAQRCPMGAHVRRSNPRDTFTPGSSQQVAISNRHRILRVGRPYNAASSTDGTSKGPDRPGLLFMCLNANIERQFEFIQQTWIMARHFQGLDGEVDSILGRGEKGGRLTIPTSSGPILLGGIQDFVTNRGGGYYFLPGKRTLRYLSSPGVPQA